MNPDDCPPALADALAEVYEIEAASRGSFAVAGHRFGDDGLTITVHLDGRPFIEGRQPGGLLFQPKEEIFIRLPLSYPLGYPQAFVGHTRFAGYENVVRGDGLCLFRSPSTDWNPDMGLAGFIRDRLWTWFERVSQGRLEQQGGAFHAPVLNGLPALPAAVVLSASEPTVARPWLGFTRLRLSVPAADTPRVSVVRVDLVGWADATTRHVAGQTFGAALFVESRLGFEFPDTLGTLLSSLSDAGLAPRVVVEHLGRTARAGTRGAPIVLTVGTPMGDGDARHFLTSLWIGPQTAVALWEAGGTRLKSAAVDRVLEAADGYPLFVCRSHEARPTVAVRRDHGAPMAWFEGRSVAVWGCGALGGPIAIAAARAGASRIVLRDRGVVSPGLLARQPYADDDIGQAKVDALRRRLLQIRPALDVAVHVGDITRRSTETDWTDGADLVIDATASVSVRAFLDLCRASLPAPVPLLTVGVDGRAERAFARLLDAGTTIGIADLERDVKLHLADTPGAEHFSDAFFPVREDLASAPFYPEPGCSESTFVGSAADMASLASSALNWAARRLDQVGDGGGAQALLTTHSYLALEGTLLPHVTVAGTPRATARDPRSGYTVAFGEAVREQVARAVADARARLGPTAETGGPLYGAWDTARRAVWIDRADPPPPDSIEAPDRFLCGIKGLSETNERLLERSRGATGFIGTWHTHPRHVPDPSSRDLASLADVFARPERLPRVFTMLIVGSPHTDPELRPHVFSRSEFVPRKD